MNKKNLIDMANHVSTIPRVLFDMKEFTRKSKPTSINLMDCNSVGCVIGHCISLDKPENLSDFVNSTTGYVNYSGWSESFTGLVPYSKEWEWCFGSAWSITDNTPIGACKRILYLVRNGKVPDNYLGMGINDMTFIRLYENIKIYE